MFEDSLAFDKRKPNFLMHSRYEKLKVVLSNVKAIYPNITWEMQQIETLRDIYILGCKHSKLK